MCVHITSFDASTITKALENFVASRQLDYRKLVGQGFDGAAVFSGCRSGVHLSRGVGRIFEMRGQIIKQQWGVWGSSPRKNF